MNSDLVNTILGLFDNDKKRPNLAVLLYFVCGWIGVAIVALRLVPFYIENSFLDAITWVRNLDDNMPIVKLVLFSFVFELIFCIIKDKILSGIDKKQGREKKCDNYASVYAIGDIVELLCAIILFFFIVSVFLQMHKTGVLFITNKAVIIYVLAICKVCWYVFQSFKHKNKRIIKEVLK